MTNKDEALKIRHIIDNPNFHDSVEFRIKPQPKDEALKIRHIIDNPNFHDSVEFRIKPQPKDEALKMAIEALETAEVQSEYDGLSDMIFKVINACKEALEQPTEQPTRLEVIDADGRTYTNWKVKELQFSYQDNGKTLKIFVTEVQDD